MKRTQFLSIVAAIAMASIGAPMSTAQAQGFCFDPAVNYPTGNFSISVFAADLDGDGSQDLAVANHGGDVSVLINDGHGTYATAFNFPADIEPTSVFAADLDGDGKKDLAVSNKGSGNVSVRRNTTTTPGIPSFDAPVNYTTGDRPYSVIAADLDGDGYQDLAIANLLSFNVSVLINDRHGLFPTKADYPVGQYAISVTAADLDRDGDLDLAVANWVSSSVAVLANDGSGIYAPAIYYLAGSQPRSVIATDLDGDGDQDLAVANEGSHDVSVLKNISTILGVPSFSTADDYVIGGSPQSVFAADLDGDGDQDLAVGNGSGGVTLLKNIGGGIYAVAANYTLGLAPFSVVASDLDEDGDLDLATANWGLNTASVLINGRSRIDVDAGPDKVLPCAVAQINLSGSSSTPGATFNWVASGGGHIVSGATTATPLVDAAGEYRLMVTDPANACTSTDVVLVTKDCQCRCAPPPAGMVAWWPLDETSGATATDIVGGFDGTAQPGPIGPYAGSGPVTSSSWPLPNFPAGMVGNSLYFYGNRRVEVPSNTALEPGTGDFTIEAWVIYTASGNGQLLTIAQKWDQGAGNGWRFVIRDFSLTQGKVSFRLPGSGYIEEIITPNTWHHVAARVSSAGGPRTARVDVDFFSSGSSSAPANIASTAPLLIGGDGVSAGGIAVDEIAIFSRSLDAPELYAIYAASCSGKCNSGYFCFRAAVNFAAGAMPYSVTAADLDGDGNQDLAVANSAGNNVSILMNISTTPGVPSFDGAMNYAAGILPWSIIAADLDGDGDRDLAVANSGGNDVQILRNTGSGTYASAGAYTVGASPRSVFAADLDQDGDQDLAVANSGSGNVSVLKNITITPGVPNFGAAVNYTAGTMPFSVTAADLDGDGKRDLAVANSGSGNVSVLKNITTIPGIPNFGAAANYAAGSVPFSVTAADLDGDGDKDLAVANPAGNEVRILRNNGVGTYSSAGPEAVGTNPRSVFAADFDGDGDQDLAVANSADNNVSVLKNISTIPGVLHFDAAANYTVGTTPYSVVAADLDGDGNQDLAVANSVGNNVSVILNCPNSGFTPTGLNVRKSLSNGVSITFGSVTIAGNTVSMTSSSGPPPPSGFSIVPTAPPMYFDIQTTASYSPPVTACFTYLEAWLLGPETDLRLLHFEGGSWVDHTTSQDVVSNVICGSVSSLSPFILVQPSCSCPRQGDINGDAVIDVFDVIDIIGIAFSGDLDPQDAGCPRTRGDVDDNGVSDVFDVIYLIATAFSGGPNPVDACGP